MSQPSQPDLASASKRVLSIDVFRGLTMLLMIFANDLDMAQIQNVPNWMKHARLAIPKIPSDLIHHITFVDVISGAFLFIVGVAIPLSMRNRRMKGEPGWQTAGHVLLRTVSLLIMGVFTGNMRAKAVEPIGISHAAWSVLMLLGLTLVWNNYPKAAGWRRGAFAALRLSGIALLVGLAIVYRKHSDDELVGMSFTNWFILGAIGWAYLVACIAYALFRRRVAGLAVCAALMVGLWIADHDGTLSKYHLLDGIRQFVSLGNTIGANASITILGVMVGMLFTEDSPARTAGRRIQWIAAVGLLTFLAGFILQPYYGLSRSSNTPSCFLYSVAICCGLYALMYWIIDVKGYQRWAGFTLPAGRNPLVAYFLHYLIHPLSIALGFAWLNGHLNAGWVGITRTLGVTVVLGIVLTDLLTRLRVRLRL